MAGGFFILDDPIFGGLAVSLIFGLFVSTVLTLLVIPAAYMAVPSRVEVENEAEQPGSLPRLTEAPHGAD